MKYLPLLGADLSGSLGGITASKNKAHAYFRARRSPVQPNSIAQLNAKSRFGSGSGIFRALSAINKALWNGFAQGIFSPRNTTNTGQFSGQQANQSLQTSFRNSIQSDKTFSVKVNDAVLVGGETFAPFLGPQNAPPVNPTSANLLLRPSGSVALNLLSSVVKNDGQFSFKMQVGDGSGADIDSFKNASGSNVGYAVFMSSGNLSANMNIQSKYRYLLGYFKHVVATAIADLDAAQDFEFTSTLAFDIGSYKTFPSVGSDVLVSVFAIDANNQMSLVGSVNTQIIVA